MKEKERKPMNIIIKASIICWLHQSLISSHLFMIIIRQILLLTAAAAAVWMVCRCPYRDALLPMPSSSYCYTWVAAVRRERKQGGEGNVEVKKKKKKKGGGIRFL
jgi:hypothetical protein